MSQQTVRLSPGEALLLAAEQFRLGRLDDCEVTLRGLLRVQPDNAEAHDLLGCARVEKGDLYEALYRFDRAIKVNKRCDKYHNNRGMVLSELGHQEEAVVEFRLAIHFNASKAVNWRNLGNALDRAARYDESLDVLDHAAKLEPNHPIGLFNRGIVLMRKNRKREALEAFNQSIAADPAHADAYYNRGMARLYLGDLKGGFADYEHRMQTASGPYYIGPFEQPQWQRQGLAGKTILVHCEQGIGDSIQFLRYVPLLNRRGAKVLLIAHRPLFEYCRAMFDRQPVELLMSGSEYPQFDYWSPLLSLPHYCDSDIDSVPPPLPIPQCYQASQAHHAGTRVGVCWSGNWLHKNDHHRSIELSKFTRILDVPGLDYVSLQHEVRPIDQAAYAQLKLVPLQTKDFHETAKYLAGLDLVVTVDTSVAHMAASLAVETWLLIPFHSQDWRWLQSRSDSPWYPTMRIFRQPAEHAWPATLAKVRAELKTFAGRAQQAA